MHFVLVISARVSSQDHMRCCAIGGTLTTYRCIIGGRLILGSERSVLGAHPATARPDDDAVVVPGHGFSCCRTALERYMRQQVKQGCCGLVACTYG